MRVLVGCEESGKVRDAFAKRGHDSWSNDLIPSRNGGQHLQMCVRDAIIKHGPWDIIILHPDCTKLSLSGNRWYGRNMKLHWQRLEAIEWTSALWELAKSYASKGCALENPTSVLWKKIGSPQYIQPNEYGHGEQKKTGIITFRLPALKSTNKVSGREQRIWKMAPSPTRKRDRSETYQGIADAMAEQWGDAS